MPVKLYMIPGSGADYRMYTPQKEAFPDLLVPQWLPPLQLKESLESYARRLSATIDTSSPFVLAGVSLGGMIAQQMALSITPLAVIMIATCNNSKALPLSRRLTGRLMCALPDGIIKLMFSLTARMVLTTHSRRKHIYAPMLQEMSPHLVRWQSGAATKWKLINDLSMPVFHIHGEKDPVIPLKNVRPQQVVKNGGHLINATHEQEVNAFISESLGKVSQPDHSVTEFDTLLRKQ